MLPGEVLLQFEHLRSPGWSAVAQTLYDEAPKKLHEATVAHLVAIKLQMPLAWAGVWRLRAKEMEDLSEASHQCLRALSFATGSGPPIAALTDAAGAVTLGVRVGADHAAADCHIVEAADIGKHLPWVGVQSVQPNGRLSRDPRSER
ncbi:unnamed protein product [Effrenium voratum]|uniref:Uncharacterized protein n=1 Tax=Effrenium voratum TaxID=2562239 RepID=A0AA36N0D1_9DINO|nr:unnamed protein product [Effrenium voratum]